MSFQSRMFCRAAGKNDKKRDKDLIPPIGVRVYKDLPYKVEADRDNLLDVYLPENTSTQLPVIVSIHGGGYVYGNKEIYLHYGMYLATLGFAVVNFNYHLAPKHKFPTQLTEINHVMEWIASHSTQYRMDMNNVFVVGDSAGAQMASHYLAIYSNPTFAKLFDFEVPSNIVKIRACGLNCGRYDMSSFMKPIPKKEMKSRTGGMGQLAVDYLGREYYNHGKKLDVLNAITMDFPPAFVITAANDFLKECALPMHEYLKSKGVESEYKCYGTKEQEYMGHVFHVNMNLAEAKECNQDETAFFRKYMV